MKTINMEKVEQLLSKFTTERNWNQFHSIKNLSMALSVETSELLEIFQWMTEADSNNVENDPETLKKIQDELADIATYLFMISARLNINLEAAIVEKIDENAKKYPVDQVLGSSKKYDEYK